MNFRTGDKVIINKNCSIPEWIGIKAIVLNPEYHDLVTIKTINGEIFNSSSTGNFYPKDLTIDFTTWKERYQ